MAKGAPQTAVVRLDGLVEVRLAGRGGTGVVTAGELLGRAALGEGRFAQAIPTFGPERRGALCTCTVRISGEPILLRCGAARPASLVVIDATIWRHAPVAAGLADGAVMLFNTTLAPGEVADELRSGRCGPVPDLETARILTTDATGIALRHLGRPITNTAMLGAFCGATGWVGWEALESVLRERFGEDAGANIAAAREGFAIGG